MEKAITIYDKADGKVLDICHYLHDSEKPGILAKIPDNNDYVEECAPGYDYKWNGTEFEELPPPVQSARDYIVQQRIVYLQLSDWTQGLDSPLSDAKKAEWATYRQALRDLPSQYSENSTWDEVVWPTRPE